VPLAGETQLGTLGTSVAQLQPQLQAGSLRQHAPLTAQAIQRSLQPPPLPRVNTLRSTFGVSRSRHGPTKHGQGLATKTVNPLQRRLQAGLPAPHRLHLAHPFSWAHWFGDWALNHQLSRQSQPSLCSTKHSAALQAIAPHGMTITGLFLTGRPSYHHSQPRQTLLSVTTVGPASLLRMFGGE